MNGKQTLSSPIWKSVATAAIVFAGAGSAVTAEAARPHPTPDPHHIARAPSYAAQRAAMRLEFLGGGPSQALRRGDSAIR